MGKISEYKEKLSLDESVETAIKYCIEHNILKDFLMKHASEVVNMLFEEMSIEEIAAAATRKAVRKAAKTKDSQSPKTCWQKVPLLNLSLKLPAFPRKKSQNWTKKVLPDASC